ncbi:M48 family metalloprotease [Micromonospora sp. WMMD737]|uniref:M48 family metalloprotease n=1 Tax=Micromonospora sp. WMMD737 TaxID=3404113 RepID=UPI003B93F2C6
MASMTARRVAPGAPAAYFALLVGAVFATALLVFFAIDLQMPGREASLHSGLTNCATAFDAEVARLAAEGGADDVARRDAAQASYRSCLRPALLRTIVVTGVGVGALALVAVVMYVAHPWWIIRRNRSRVLDPGWVPGLGRELARLERATGLARAPQWWFAPRRGTPSGQAFGLPGRRRIQLDAGLLVLRATEPSVFRAVVAHELAHLRNRDVDVTYLTIAVWRAFLLVAVLPPMVLVLHPSLLVAPTAWSWRATLAGVTGNVRLLGSLLVLTCLVYLLRNAVLRAREIDADALAAHVDGPGGALLKTLSRLPAPRGPLARWGTHPSPEKRVRALRDVVGVGMPTHWNMVAAGLPAGILTANTTLAAGVGLGLDPLLGTALLGAAVGPWLGVLLALGVWRAARTAMVAPVAAYRIPFWLTAPLVLVGAYLAGMQVSLRGVTGQPGSVGTSGPASTTVAALVLALAAVVLAAWTDSIARAVAAGDGSRAAARQTPPAVLGAAALTGAVGVAVWLPYSLIPFGFALAPGPAPADGGGWYAVTARLSTADLGPAHHFVANVLTLPTLTALWLVPAVLLHRVAPTTGWLRAALVGLGGGVLAGLVGALLPVAARVMISADVRRAVPASSEISFSTVLDNTTIAVGSLLVAVVMAVVVAGPGSQRPARALLAANVTALVATAAIWWVAGPVRCLTGVGLCRPGLDLNGMALTAHWTLVQGLFVAVPLVLAVTARGARRPSRHGVAVALSPVATASAVTGLALLIAVTAALVWGMWEPAYGTWLRGGLR